MDLEKTRQIITNTIQPPASSTHVTQKDDVTERICDIRNHVRNHIEEEKEEEKEPKSELPSENNEQELDYLSMDTRVKNFRSEAAPWLGWDFQDLDESKSRACLAVQHVNDGCGVSTMGSREENNRRDQGEEPATNRMYGTEDDVRVRESSANKLFAFQTDRVVRVLEKLFEGSAGL